MSKKALIYGITGQDGAYLAKNLLEHDYKVFGVYRRCSTSNFGRLKYLNIYDAVKLIEGDVTDFASIISTLSSIRPDHVYNLAAQSHVATSFEAPLLTFDVTGKGCFNLLEAIRLHSPWVRFYQASSSEMFGKSFSVDNAYGKFQNESTPMIPQSPYGIAKLAAYNATRLYREAYDIFACNGILFNHESELRGENFVTQKIASFAGKISANLLNGEHLRLGNLAASRDWGHAEDYVEAMRLMLEYRVPDDYVVATGETHTVENFLEEAFEHIGVPNYREYVIIDEKLLRPAEVPYLRGCASYARARLGWYPKITFKQLVARMVNAQRDSWLRRVSRCCAKKGQAPVSDAELQWL